MKGRGTFIHYTTKFSKRSAITLGSQVRIEHHTMLEGTITISDNTYYNYLIICLILKQIKLVIDPEFFKYI